MTKRVKQVSDNKEKKERLKEILAGLRSQNISTEIKERAKELFQSLDIKTLGLLEQELIREGISREEIRKSLCDVHLDILKETLVRKRIEVSPPHPVHTFMEEHKHILDSLEKLKRALLRIKEKENFGQIKDDLEVIREVAKHLIEAESHHQREEDVLFPQLIKYGITEPVEIMKQDHTEFKEKKKEFYQTTHNAQKYSFREFKGKIERLGNYLSEVLEKHIFKEDHILYQIALQILSPQDWDKVKRECDKIGYCCFTPKV